MQVDPVDEIARQVHGALLKLDRQVSPPKVREHVVAAAPLFSPLQVQTVVERVMQLLIGLGPLDPLLDDPTITELMVNGPGRVWVERDGELTATDILVDKETLRLVIDRILTPLGLRVDRTAPFVDARLADGSRVNVAVPPLAVDGPYLTIRRFREQPFLVDEYCGGETKAFLVDAVVRRKSIVVSGGTGSGKTSFLNALAGHVGDCERVVTIEDAAELRLPGSHTVRLEARPANAEGIGQVSIRSLVRNALRMRPDRIIVGEVRGAEAFDMIQAMNTGHDGSMSTCHANSPLDALRRIEAMALMSDVNVPPQIMHEHVTSAVDVVVQLARGSDGKRRVHSIYRAGEQPGWVLRADDQRVDQVRLSSGRHG